jgi:co-chaperonin GroES (HSP10)
MTTETLSGLILPPGIALPTHIQPMETQEESADDETKAGALPTPTGWKILCVVPEVDAKLAGTTLDLVRDTASMRGEEHGTTVLFVLRTGPDVYKDTTKFPTGAWCKDGDFVLVRTYTGTRFKIFGKEFRLINDDQVEAVVMDPRGLTRA